jgi:hypothetical protein
MNQKLKLWHVANVKEACAPPPKKPNNVVNNFNYKVQDIWVVKMPWEDLIFNDVWLVFDVKCYGYTKIRRKEKVLDTKWDSIIKKTCM